VQQAQQEARERLLSAVRAAAEEGASVRAIADTVGHSHVWVVRDLNS
jgi:isopropylmalate/homocitrate/citramalate synthase